MRDFKEKLKSLRAEKGLTRAQLAKLLGITPSAIGMYERGERLPNMEVMKEISKYFKVDYNYLLDDEYDIKFGRERETGKKTTEKRAGYLVDPVSLDAAKFIYENPEYVELFECIKTVDKKEINFVKTMIEKLK